MAMDGRSAVEPHCCFIDPQHGPCPQRAIWLLVDGPGPDDFTHSCDLHVESLKRDDRVTHTWRLLSDDERQATERKDRAERLVLLTRAIRDVLDPGLAAHDLEIRLRVQRTLAPPYEGVHEGYTLDASVQHPTEEPTRISFTIFMGKHFERVIDDVLSVQDAAARGME